VALRSRPQVHEDPRKSAHVKESTAVSAKAPPTVQQLASASLELALRLHPGSLQHHTAVAGLRRHAPDHALDFRAGPPAQSLRNQFMPAVHFVASYAPEPAVCELVNSSSRTARTLFKADLAPQLERVGEYPVRGFSDPIELFAYHGQMPVSWIELDLPHFARGGHHYFCLQTKERAQDQRDRQSLTEAPFAHRQLCSRSIP